MPILTPNETGIFFVIVDNMNQNMSTLNHSGWFPILTAVLMLSFWTLFALFLPMQEAYIAWVLDSDWTWINIIGFAGSLIGIFALNSIFSALNSSSHSDFVGYFLGVTGIAILTAVLFFEAFILKGIALESPDLIDLNGGFYQHVAFKIANLTGGVLLTLGVLMLGISMLQKRTFKKWKVILFMLACPLFGIVAMPGNLRLLGVALYAISLIAIGVEMNRRTDTN